ncbi:7TM diverse intracellular signaling domain-containing protein [Neolewinella persica]|uniref:7TM diverse intracellular signaling domain-containing protein n=1 Tax=Neolewinella persica TaxID=70998 RepID=UPI00037DC992|nr:7TM diverse intracellular signaling domain-containing protein [Neolewinella persica]
MKLSTNFAGRSLVGRVSSFVAPRPTSDLAIVLWLLLAATTTLSAQSPGENGSVGILALEDNDVNYRLISHLEILSDSAGLLSIEDVSTQAVQSAFQAYRAYPEEMTTNHWYWGKVEAINRLPTAESNLEWVLYFPTNWTTLEVYTKDETGAWAVQQAGTHVPLRKKQFAPTAWGNLVKLSLPPDAPTTIYFRGKGEAASVPPAFSIYLQTTDRFYARMNKVRVRNAIFIGFLGMMLLYNLIVYFFGRDRSFLYYSGYLLMIIVYSAQSNDDLADWFGDYMFVDHPHHYSVFKAAIFIGLACYLAFIRKFIDLKQLLPGWDRYFRGLTYLGLFLFFVHQVVSVVSNFSFVVEDLVSVPYIVLVIGSCVAALYPLYRTGDANARFIFAGITAISIGALLSLLTRVVFPPFNIVFLKVGVVAEVLIFSLGLAYWQREQVKAKERADFDLRESRLVQEQQEVEAGLLREDNRKNALLAERSRENEVLLKEIHHRVKNNLEVVSSLLELQSVTLTDGDARDAMLAGRSRVTTMGLLHQKLYQGDHLGTVGMREYFSDLTRNLGHTFGVKGRVTFTINVPKDLRLDIDTAVPLGLIANELITNSIKYAFEGAAAGAVEVEMSRVGERYLLAVSDDGSGKAGSPVEGTGFGTRLVGMLVQQLEGEVREVSGNGVRTEVHFLAP